MRTIVMAMLAAMALSLVTAGPMDVREQKILFLHHSTGEVVWNAGVPEWFARYNAGHGTKYVITEQAFPNDDPYGWNNYPYDYWNIWVKHAGPREYKGEPTLEILTRKYDVIVFKHCFPGSDVGADEGKADIASDAKTPQNYKLQYGALKEKLRRFPKTKFILWTNPAQTKSATNDGDARRAKQFGDWVRETWDEQGDNIFLWDFRRLETEGGLYAKPGYTVSGDDPHPGPSFAKRVAPLFAQRIVDIIEGRGDSGSRIGQ